VATVRLVPVVDLVLALLLVLGALHGFKVGALTQLFTFAGFWLGMTVAALLAAAIVPAFSSLAAQAGFTLALVLGLGFLFGVLGRVVGVRAHLGLRQHRLGGLDAALGVAVAAAAVLLSAWLLGSILSQSRFSSVSAAIQRSAILRAVDNVLPPVPSVFSRLQAFLQAEGFPTVFAGLVPTLPGGVSGPGQGQTQAVGGAVADSTAKVLGVACGQQQEGSAFVVGPGMLVTNAHVVAGEAHTEVVVRGVTYPATTVFFDPNYDLAVLRTGAPLGPPLSLDPATVPRGTQGVVAGYPQDGPLTFTPAGVAGTIDAAGRNIYNDGVVVRQIYQVAANVEPGNSGSPLVATNGQVVGMVFSRSTASADVGYALTSPGVLGRVQQASVLTTAVSTGACVAG
jgi:S1-C subfamily serine protease